LEANHEGVVGMVPVIVIPVLNRYDLLERCLESIDYPVGTLLIIDNGGKAGLHDQPWLVDRRHVQDYRVLSMPSNLGVATSWNLSIKATPYSKDGWLLLNSDAWFEPGALQQFHGECSPDTITLAGRPGWSCAHVGRNVVAKVGLFCENFHPAYFEDNDFERRAQAHGIPIVHSSAKVNHDNSSTIASDPSLAEANAKSFQCSRNGRWNVDANWDGTNEHRSCWLFVG
jgi:GT2 family glycosyltransferase